jgi:iron(III) transport system ATP-binding protein
MRFEIRQIVERLGVTTLFVTHEQIEALTMSDTVAVMKEGVIVQEGSPTAIYGSPAAEFVANFIGRSNFLRGCVTALDDANEARLAHVQTRIGTLACQVEAGTRIGDAMTVLVRPEHVTLGPAGAVDVNRFGGTVETIIYGGNMLECLVAVEDERLRLQLHPSVALASGAAVSVHLPVEHCRVMRQ